MKKLVYLFCFILLGLQCQATEIFPLSNLEPTPIDGKIKSHGNRDIITVNGVQPDNNIADNLWEDTDNIRQVSRALIAVDNVRRTAAKDPYLVQIDGKNYIMIKDNPSKKWSKNDILGIDDTKTTLFRALKSIESDGDIRKITSQELKRANIRFARIDSNGVVLANDKKQDYNLDKINYIDMINLRKLANSSITGVFGHFNLYLKTNNNSKKMVIGYVTLHTDDDIQIQFK